MLIFICSNVICVSASTYRGARCSHMRVDRLLGCVRLGKAHMRRKVQRGMRHHKGATAHRRKAGPCTVQALRRLHVGHGAVQRVRNRRIGLLRHAPVAELLQRGKEQRPRLAAIDERQAQAPEGVQHREPEP